MYQIKGKEKTYQVDSLSEALNQARLMNEFVTIQGTDFELCGIFGVDSIRDGLCPDGVKYDWNKSSRIGASKRKERIEQNEEDH
jgi:hypothetical protein